MEFAVKIHLGNDSMQTGEDIAFALAGIASQLEYLSGYSRPLQEHDACAHRIKDGNGATVGEWSITDE
jgi:hypothetical protein